ncbi:MAG: hypothetical protein HY811_11855 [Planctomycetes bacterium]|nr:hypothetical protein [Planctomycetota bacterium]
MKAFGKILAVIIMLLILNGFSYADTSYFRELVNKGNATYYDACRIAAILQTGKDSPKAKFEELRDGLLADKIIPSNWGDKKENDFLSREELAYMLFKILKLKGGLTVKLFGLSPRYAFRECVDKKLLASGYPGQLLSGEELISILANSGDYQEENNDRKEVSTPQENKQPVTKREKEEPKKEIKEEKKTGNKEPVKEKPATKKSEEEEK